MLLGLFWTVKIKFTSMKIDYHLDTRATFFLISVFGIEEQYNFEVKKNRTFEYYLHGKSLLY